MKKHLFDRLINYLVASRYCGGPSGFLSMLVTMITNSEEEEIEKFRKIYLDKASEGGGRWGEGGGVGSLKMLTKAGCISIHHLKGAQSHPFELFWPRTKLPLH